MAKQVYECAFTAMGSPCQIQVYAQSEPQAHAAISDVIKRITSLEAIYSRYREDSLISLINRRAGRKVVTPIDAETFALLGYANQCYVESQGLFDVTSGVLRQIWHAKQIAIPTASELHPLLNLIGWPKVQWNKNAIYLPVAGMQLDFGGIVKEYAADVAAGICLSRGINSGIIELGGDVRVIGSRPDNKGWPVAIRDPRQPDKVIAEFEMKQGALASSGDYERFQMINGVRYSHLLNPKTGWPVSGLRAVSVIAEQCLVAGSVATIAMLKANAGQQWLKSCRLPYLTCRNNGKIVNHLFTQ